MNRSRTIALTVAFAAVASLSLATLLAPSTSSAYIAKITNSTDTAASASYFTCASAIAPDVANAIYQLPLNEASASVSAVNKANAAAPGTYIGSMTTSTSSPLACSRDTGGAYVLDGSTSYVSTGLLQVSPATFSTEVWFKTSVASGVLVGYGNTSTGTPTSYDRLTYLAPTGQLVFGTYNGSSTQTIYSASGTNYADGNWHDVVTTFSATAGMTLYVDGRQVATNSSYVTAETDIGYWRFGYDNLNGWPNIGSNYFFKGSMRFAGIYRTVLTAAQVQTRYAAGQ